MAPVPARTAVVVHTPGRWDKRWGCRQPALGAGERAGGQRQLPLFEVGPSDVEKEIERMDVDTMTPVDALVKLKELQRKTKKG